MARTTILKEDRVQVLWRHAHPDEPILIRFPCARGETLQEITIEEAKQLIKDLEAAVKTAEERLKTTEKPNVMVIQEADSR